MRSFMALLIVAGLTSVVGCDKNEINSAQAPAPSSSVPYNMVGTWTPIEVDSGYSAIPLNVFFRWQPTTVSEAITFESDGGYSAKQTDANGATTYTETGTITISGSNFNISVKTANGQPLDQAIQRSGQCFPNGDALSLSIPSGGRHDYYLLFDKN
jgi:hypothetical protein